MISKKQFCDIMHKLETHRAKIDVLEDVFGVVLEMGTLEDVVVDLLNELMGLEETKEFGSDIDFFVYELDFGEKWNEDSIKVDGKSVDISTAEKLYDFITSDLS